MALDENVIGLSADEPQIKATMPKTGGLSLAGQKGVSLNPTDSNEIRNRLMQMIAQREEAASGWGPIMERAAVSAGGPGTFAQNLQSYGTNQRNREKELFDMRVGLAQLNTEESRIKQAQEQAAQNQLNFTNAMRAEQGLPPLPSAPQAGAAPAPQGGMSPAPQGGAAPAPQASASNISPTQMAMLQQMYADPSTRAEAQKQYFALTKQDDMVRRLKAAGVQPGTPQFNAAMFTNVVGANAFNPQDIRTAGGDVQQTPYGAAGAILAGTPPVAAAPALQGGLASVAGATPRPAAAPALQGGLASTAPVPAAPVAPALATGINPATGFTYGSKQDLDEIQKEAAVARAGRTREVEKVAETSAEEQKQHSADVRQAQNNAMLAQNMQKDIKTAGTLLGKLAGGGAQSAFFGLIDGGIAVGNMGAINLPKFTEAVVKMDPNAKKPEVMDAYKRVAQDVEQLKLDYTRKVFQGQGAVTENERRLIDTAVGDVNRMSPANLMRMAKATELEARNKVDQDRLWSQMRNAGLSWSQYKNSPDFKELQRQQFYRTAKTFGIKDAVYPGDPAR